jgi:hypothetical protein
MNTSYAANNKSLYVIIRDEVTDWIIKNGLSKTESKLFFYFLKLDRFGDKPVRLKVAEILLATGIGKTAYHAAIAKFEALGWFDFRHTDVTISNQTGLSSSEKRTEKPESRTEKPESRTEKPESRTEKPNQESEKTNNQPPEPLPDKPSEVPHTIQTYSDSSDNTDQDCGVENSDFQKEDQASGINVLLQFEQQLKIYQIYLSVFDQESGLLIPNPKIESIYSILEEMSPEKAESAIRAFLAWLSTAKNIRCRYAAFAASLRNQWEINQ